MRLRRFEVDGFAQLKHVEMTFLDGVPNLIVAPHEAERDCLLQALRGVLFGLERPNRFKPWFTEAPVMRGILEFDDDEGRQVRVERNFETNAFNIVIEGESTWSMNAGARARMVEQERYLVRLERWLGFSDADLFTASTIIHQADVLRASVEGQAPQIKNLITGSGEATYEDALADLRRQLEALQRPPGRNSPRLLERKEQELLELEEALEHGRSLQDRIAGLQESQERLTRTIAARETALAQKRRQLGRVQDVVEREDELARLEVEFEGLTTLMNQFVAAHERIERARIVRERVSAAEDVDLVSLLELEHNVRLAHQRLDIAREQASRMPAWIHVGTWLIAALGALIGVIFALFVNWLLLAILLLFMVVGGLVAWRFDLLPQERERRTAAVVEAEHALEEARARRAQVLDRLGVGTVEETLTLRKTYEFSDRALDKAQAALLALGNEKQTSERYQQVSVRLTSLRYRVADALRSDDELRALGTAENRATYCESLEEQVRALERSLVELRRERETIEHELLTLSVDEPDIPLLFQHICALRTEIADLHRRSRALEMAIETLEGCTNEFHEQSLHAVMGIASRLLHTLTDGRYTGVTLTPHNLEPHVDTPDHADIPGSQLCQWGQDQLYFALRVALAQALAQGKRLPIVFDDPYVNLEQERLERTSTLIRSLSSHTQVLIVTCNPRYEEWFEPVLRLGRSSVPVGGERRAIS